MTYTLLIISFDPNQAKSIQQNFAGTAFRLISLGHTEITAEKIRNLAPDLGIVVGDSPAAIEACAKLKTLSGIPVIVTTLQRDSISELSAIRTGADDYLVFDPNSPTLQIKISRILRSKGIRPTLEHKSSALKMDLAKREITLHGVPLHLTRTEFELLRYLLENPNRVIHRQELMNRHWEGWQSADHVLEVHLSRLRQKILHAGGKLLFRPVRGVGYRLDK